MQHFFSASIFSVKLQHTHKKNSFPAPATNYGEICKNYSFFDYVCEGEWNARFFLSKKLAVAEKSLVIIQVFDSIAFARAFFLILAS